MSRCASVPRASATSRRLVEFHIAAYALSGHSLMRPRVLLEAAQRGGVLMRSMPIADAVIDYAKRVKDWPTLEIAVDGIKTIRDEAERMKLYAKQPKDETMMAAAGA